MSDPVDQRRRVQTAFVDGVSGALHDNGTLLAAGVVGLLAGAVAARRAWRGGTDGDVGSFTTCGSHVRPGPRLRQPRVPTRRTVRDVSTRIPGYVIKTDNRWHELKYRQDVPKKVLKSDFDWLEDDSGFMKWKGDWHHLSQFERLTPGALLDAGWDGAMPWSYSNGALIKLHSDGERYKIAYFYLSGDTP